MEKYSQDNDLLLRQLQDEEHDLMRKVSLIMSSPEKTASEEQDLSRTDQRLHQVRQKIDELRRNKN